MKIQSVRGMHDLFGVEGAKFEKIISIGKNVAFDYAFETLHTPILEFSELFERNLGQESDVVSKEIYKFKDRSDHILALRPEFTASIVRAFAQYSMQNNVLPKRFFSYGPLFRYDRPQAGRYRQFNQLNFEVIGVESPAVDVECIVLANDLLVRSGVLNYELNINFLGGKETCSNYEKALQDYLRDHYDSLSEDSKRRLNENPLRILDSKDANDIKIISNVPYLAEYYSNKDKEYFNGILELLTKINIPYKINNHLVRGLDYYTGVVFEFVAKQGFTVLGGGRYDNLIEQISGKVSVPAIGFAAGIERLMLCGGDILYQKNEKFGIIYYSKNELYYAMWKVAKKLRDKGNMVEIIHQDSNMGKKFSKADQLGCTKVVVCGPEEEKNSTVKIKDLVSGIESVIALNDL